MADRFKFSNAFEFAIERPFIGERGSVNNFHRAAGAGCRVSSKPDFAVGSGTDPLQKFHFGHPRRFERGSRAWRGGVQALDCKSIFHEDQILTVESPNCIRDFHPAARGYENLFSFQNARLV
jgi:hypothetical protein